MGLYLTSGACSWHENTNTGEPISQESGAQAADRQLHIDSEHATRLELPLL